MIYEKQMHIRPFGNALIATGDLDPVYVALYKAHLPVPQLQRLLLAYWCFYHLGLAAYLSEFKGDAYWEAMLRAADNKTLAPVGKLWPRATERRHFRGEKCVKAINWFSRNQPEFWVHSLARYKTETDVMAAVEEWPQFGPWIAFKAADMLERVMGQPIKFSENIGLMYESPREGLRVLQSWGGGGTAEEFYAELMEHFGKLTAPPGYDRKCGAQEVETILCKWKSHVSGHYTVGKDIKEVAHTLAGGWGKTANKIAREFAR